MEKLFNISVDKLKEVGGYATAEEIHHQPRLWKETLEILSSDKERISSYLSKQLSKKGVKVILTGAGTSAYIGDTAVPYLSKILDVEVESIATTEIVSSPEDYLEREVPTILVSFARSGDSPESVATYELAEKLVDDLSQIIITCNKEGSLAKRAKENENNLVILMPEESNDKSFAMTSSFTCMLLTALTIFDMKNLEKNIAAFNKVISNGKRIIDTEIEEILKIVKLYYDRVVYLGSSALRGLSKEASLKNLELTSGKIFAVNESVLGFRHGPKSIVNDKTLVFMFMSNNDYTRKYDMDLLKEICNDEGEHKVISITYNKDVEIEKISDKTFVVNEDKQEVMEDAFAALNFIIYAQVFSLFYSLELGISPDNPRPSGTVNRVVKGVNIYQYN
ncbi:SIS domain-containing protein [Clostridium brassicae]|uniref:SIS domain-containing protein n=1 Tax=Clostridium brassicae TaxID=2999072 RepID=A0ABT4DE27_9CLOT|nr:SIS domain-containing protein [Clostridium brassicae]MCY6960569.1 SIS domain-containing protein [Clostridium brassicae]